MTRRPSRTRPRHRAGERPGRDRAAVRLPAPAPGGPARDPSTVRVAVAGGGIAGLAAAAALAERGVAVTLLEREDRLGGRVRSWPVRLSDGSATTMSRGFHAFFRQYYTLRSLLRRVDPALERLRPLEDYPLVHESGMRDSFAGIPRAPGLNLLAFVARSPSFTVADLARVDRAAALGLLDVNFPATFSAYDGVSAAELLDGLRFPRAARHLALEVFSRSFFADPSRFSAGELVAMFHTYFLGSAEGLLFDVPDDDYDTVLWAPLGRYLTDLGVDVRTGTPVTSIAEAGDRLVIGTAGEDVVADALVLATDRRPLQRLVADAPSLWRERDGEQWRARVEALQATPPFAVWRLWLDRPVKAGSPPFLATAAFGALDNVSQVHLFEAGAARWADARGGSVVELHAYAVPVGLSSEDLRADLRAQLGRLHPELGGAGVAGEEWLVRDDCPLVSPAPWRDRPGVRTPDPRVVLAGDGVRCEAPVALMERAAMTGVQAANALLAGWGLPGHDLWSVPLRSRHQRVVAPLRRVLSGWAG